MTTKSEVSYREMRIKLALDILLATMLYLSQEINAFNIRRGNKFKFCIQSNHKLKVRAGTSLVVHWLGLRTLTAKGLGSTPG